MSTPDSPSVTNTGTHTGTHTDTRTHTHTDNRALWASRLFYLLLWLTALANVIWLAPPHTPLIARGAYLLATMLPVLVFLPAIITGDTRLLTWFCFVLLFYFCAAVWTAVDPMPRRALGVTNAVLISALFTAVMLHIRQRKRDHD